MLVLFAGMAGAAPVSACTGEPLRLEEISAAARAVVLVQVVGVGPPHAQDVPASFTLRVDQVLYGSAPPTIEMTWPTPIDICDGYIATLGDRFYMAMGVGEYSPIWPVKVSHLSGAERSDLAQLMAILAVRPRQTPVDLAGASAVVLVALLLVAAAVSLGRRRRIPH